MSYSKEQLVLIKRLATQAIQGLTSDLSVAEFGRDIPLSDEGAHHLSAAHSAVSKLESLTQSLIEGETK
tara:strand:+ start:357 stop:563 length:207 start_codon:yes stop_codon:yes gene_type:complete